MVRILWKSQWKTVISLLGFFAVALLFSVGLESKTGLRFLSEQTAYLSHFSDQNLTGFFDTADADLDAAQSRVDSIENYEEYEGNLFTEMQDPVLAAAGIENAADYDMLVWKEKMLQMPGTYTDSIENDARMLRQLLQRLENERKFQFHLDNQLELARRGMRRNDGSYLKYAAAEKELKKINSDFPLQDPVYAERILSYLEKDFYLILLLALTFFAAFSNTAQTGVVNQIVLSSMGIRKYVKKQLAAAVCVTIAAVSIYMGLLLLIFGGTPDHIPWALPLQAVNGYETVTFAVSVGGYLVLLLAFKLLFCLFHVFAVLLLSLLSRNTIVSALLVSAYCGVLLFLYHLLSGQGAFAGDLLIGSCRTLLSEHPFLMVGNAVIPCHFCAAAAIIAGTGGLWFIMVLLAKRIAERRVL